jgi:hypothetical protein
VKVSLPFSSSARRSKRAEEETTLYFDDDLEDEALAFVDMLMMVRSQPSASKRKEKGSRDGSPLQNLEDVSANFSHSLHLLCPYALSPL